MSLKRNRAFVDRHIGPRSDAQEAMLAELGYESLDRLTKTAVPDEIHTGNAIDMAPGLSESEALEELAGLARQNKVLRSFLGGGYFGTHTPAVIQRGILENPGWYTQYTPYQAEISQGRLESLLNFQTMIMELTAMPVANASVLDEGTAAAEAMAICDAAKNADGSRAFFVSEECYEQTRAVVETRALPRNIKIIVGDHNSYDFSEPLFGALLQYPGKDGRLPEGLREFSEKVHGQGGLVVMATDLLSLCLVTPPGELGADLAVGSAQRFGVPLGYGGPHAGYLAASSELTRRLPGRIVGISKDAEGQPAIRLSLQTREQHIRREKATSNICTAQALLANMAAMYGVYHGPDGLREIAGRVHGIATRLAATLRAKGLEVTSSAFFDTLEISCQDAAASIKRALAKGINILELDGNRVRVAFDETTTITEAEDVAEALLGSEVQLASEVSCSIPETWRRKSSFMQQSVFNKYHSETELMRYMRRLELADLSLVNSMIPLGSCTMKLNAAAELMPVSWPEFGGLHPFAPVEQAQGYRELFRQLESMLCAVTGFDAFSLQPNSGAQGEYAGLLTIRAYHEANGQSQRNVCLIPSSAHGTNPASAVMAGMKVVVVKCDSEGNIDVADLKAKSEKYGDSLSSLMITYPSTHGVFEKDVVEICKVVHQAGGQVYMDGANMNAQIGLCYPGEFGPDVCHLNLHKTFCIPHGGGGPGVGPIGVRDHLKPFLPNHNVVDVEGGGSLGPISAAPWGSASILPISWMYMRMMGGEGLKLATQVAILNANYIAKRLSGSFEILYRGEQGLVAHECIIDLRSIQKKTGVTVEDVAKRLIDYGFHAPTMAWPVPGTLMIEPTESESKEELDRFCEAMIEIRKEISEIESGKADRKQNLLKNAPHPAVVVAADNWERPYSRERAAYPLPWVRDLKFWPKVARVDNAFGDRNFVCSCAPLEDYES